MPFIANPNPGPQSSWASTDPLQQFISSSTAWANDLKTTMSDLAASIATPNFTVSWGDITGGIPLNWGAPYDKPERTTVITIPMTVDAPNGPSTPLSLGAIPDVTAPGVGVAPLWDVVLPPEPGAFTMPSGSPVTFSPTVLDAYVPTVPDAPVSTVAGMTTAVLPTAPSLVSAPNAPVVTPVIAESFGDVTLPVIDTALPTAPVVAPSAMGRPMVEAVTAAARTIASAPMVSAVAAPALVDPSVSALSTLVPDAPTTTVSPLLPTPVASVGYAVQMGPSPVALSPRTVAELSALALPAFTLTADVGNLDELVDTFSFVPGTYVSTLKDSTSAALASVLGGQPIIGATAFDDIFIAAADDISVAYQDEILLAGNTCGMLGELPSEALAVRLDSATRKQRQGVQKARLTAAIEQAKAWREDLWKGVEASQAFEQLWSGFFIADEGRQLQAVTALTEARVAVYNTKVARFNALLSNVQAHLGVAAEQRQRALLVIEDHKARLEHKEADLREADRFLAAYQAQWQGVQIDAAANASLSDVRVRTSLAELEEKKARHTAEIEEVQQAIAAYQATVQGRQVEIAASAENRNAEALKIDAYRARLAGLELERKAIDQQIAAFQADVQAASAEVNAAVSIADAKTKASLAQLEVERAAQAAEISRIQQEIAAYQAQVQAVSARTAIAGEERAAQSLLIDAYRAKLAGAELSLKATERDIALFQAQTQAYSAQVGAQTAVFNSEINAANIDVEQRKAQHAAALAEYTAAVQVYQAQVQALNSQTAAAAEQRERALVGLQDYRAQLEHRKLELEDADIQLKGWLGQWDAYTKSSGAQTAAFAERVRGFMAETEGKKLELSASVEISKATLAKEMAAVTSFSEIWKGIATKAQAVLTQMQSLSVPVELQIKSEEARTRSESMTLTAALENAKNEMTKGIETAKLRLSQLNFASTQSIETSKALASLMAHTMGAYLSAGSVHYSVSSSESYSNGNSYSMTKAET